MKHSMKLLAAAGVLALVAPLAGSGLTAQSLRFDRRTGGFASLGFGGGNIQLTCDSGCVGDRLGAGGALLDLGRHVSRRVRIELGLQYQNNREFSSNAFSASLGAAVYLVGNLHLRGAASYLNASFQDSTGTYDGKGVGFMVGGGYDLHISRQVALTPYVSYSTGSLSTIDVALGGGSTAQTSGSLQALHFGLSLTRLVGHFVCTTASGEDIRLTRRNRFRFAPCLADVERRLGRSAGTGFKP